MEYYIVNIQNYKVNKIEDVKCPNALLGTGGGEICSYDPLSNQAILKKKFHNEK